jgi:hypothetical protein
VIHKIREEQGEIGRPSISPTTYLPVLHHGLAFMPGLPLIQHIFRAEEIGSMCIPALYLHDITTVLDIGAD